MAEGFSYLVDGIIILFLAVTIVYAVILNRKLATLRNAKEEMEALFKTFTDSTNKAGEGLGTLRDTADGAGQQLQEAIHSANRLADDLAYLAKKGEIIADRLDQSSAAARHTESQLKETEFARTGAAPTAERPDVTPFLKALSEKQAGKSGPMGSRTGQADGPDPQEDAGPQRSPEESALLKALQGMR
ncbi:MAG: DUF6468 domain-containing protein [Pseudomonadota bacterium]